MTGKHRHWHRRWRLDGAGAVHDSGLRVTYAPWTADAAVPAIGGVCTTSDGDLWSVVVGDDAALDAWIAAQLARGLDAASVHAHLARLIREAGDLWVWQGGPA